MLRPLALVLPCLLCLACPGVGPTDAGQDSGTPGDAGADAGSDGGTDAGTDGGTCTSPCIPVLDVIQCPQLTVEYGCTVVFPRLSVGGMSTETVTLLNSGNAALHISAISLDAGVFSVGAGPSMLAPQQSAVLPVTFKPTDAGTFQTELIIDSDSALLPARRVIVMGGTPGAACSAQPDCLLGETCQGSSCASCVMPTPPPCFDGNVVSSTRSDGCLIPVCRCADDQVYAMGHCAPRVSCDSDGGCDAGTCDANACCSFPVCLCTAAPACR